MDVGVSYQRVEKRAPTLLRSMDVEVRCAGFGDPGEVSVLAE
jgi:hypothetical protein